MPTVLEPSWVGRRVSVRRVLERRPDGSLHLGDVVGDLVGLDAQTAVIDSRAGLVEVPLPLVAVARLAPPSTADELALEAVAARGLRAAESEEIDGWVLRADPGGLGRANSVLPLRQLRIPLDDALARAHDWYAARGLPLRVQIPTEARRLLDAELGERGWEPSGEMAVLARRLDVPVETAAAPSGAAAGEARLSATPSPEWTALLRDGTAGPHLRDLLARHDSAVFAEVHDGGSVVAIARGAVDDGWLGVTALETAPTARRRGLARRAVRALHDWALEHGATRAYAQVAIDNEASLALMDALGYRLHHDYRYRTESAAGERP